MKHKLVNFYRYAILGVVFLMTTAIYSQTKSLTNPTQKQLDSLESYYNLSKTDSLPLSERLENVTSYLEGILPSQQDSLIYNGLMVKTWLLSKVKQYDSAIVYSHQIYDLAKQNQDTLYIGYALIKLGIYHKKNNELTDSFKYYNEGFKISKNIKDSINMGRNLLQMANIQTSLGDYSGSKTTAIDGLKYLEHTSDLRNLAGLYHIISVANLEQKNYTKAIQYNTQALELGKDSISIQTIGLNHILMIKNTKANILADQGNYKQAIEILKTLISNPIVQQDKIEYARVLTNLGRIQWYENKENKSSEALLLNSLEIRKRNNDISGLISSNVCLTKYYLVKDKKKALYYAEAAYLNAKKRNNLVSILEALGFVFQLKEDVQEEAMVYDRVHHKMQEINQKNREIYAVTKYENKKLTQQNVVLQKEKNKIAIWGIVISGLLILSIGGIVYYYYKQYVYKKRFLQLLATNTQQDSIPTPPKDKTTLSVISEEALQHLLNQLQQFEEQQTYLTPNINAKDLAKSFGSNTSYLSMVVNTYKQKSISQYINDLRVDFAIEKLQVDPIFRKYTIKAIAQEVGFNSSEIFAKKFYKKTGIYPSYFVKKLEGEKDEV